MKGKVKFDCRMSPFIVALLISIQVQGQVSMERNINRQASDYKSVPTAGAEECRQACANDQNCQAYTWVPQAGGPGPCWLKNAVPQPTAQAGYVSGVKSHVSIEQDTNRQALDYTNLQTPGAEECRQACTNDQNCQAFTWVPQADSQGMCWLKNGVPQPLAHAGWVSGVKSFSGAWQPPKPQNILEVGEMLLPGDYLISTNGRWKLEFRANDGNVVLYNTVAGDTDNGRFFGTDTGHTLSSDLYPLGHFGSGDCGVSHLQLVHYALMRDDGNFVVHLGWAACPEFEGSATGLVFQSKTSGHSGAFLRVEDDGNVVIYDQKATFNVIWHRGLWPW